jgi:hypothetical protein
MDNLWCYGPARREGAVVKFEDVMNYKRCGHAAAITIIVA